MDGTYSTQDFIQLTKKENITITVPKVCLNIETRRPYGSKKDIVMIISVI